MYVALLAHNQTIETAIVILLDELNISYRFSISASQTKYVRSTINYYTPSNLFHRHVNDNADRIIANSSKINVEYIAS